MSALQSTLFNPENQAKNHYLPSGRAYAGVISRDEMNLAEFPLTVLSTRVNTEVKTLEFKDSIRTKNGELIEREWVITGAAKFGLPTATDDDVILGLMCLTMDQGYRERKVFFSRYELLKILRWSTEGRSYMRLSKSLDRLSGVRIRASNAFFDNAAKGFQTCNFGIIDQYEINDTRGSGEKSYFIWSEMLFDSFRSGFIKKIDLDFYFSLKSSVSRRLYRYLDKHFYHRSIVEKPLLTLAFEKLGLSRSYQYVSSIKQQLEPAAEELKERGFLESFEFLGRGATTLARFTQGKEAPDAKRLPAAPAPANPSANVISIADNGGDRKRRIGEKLEQHGLSSFQAKRLLAKKDETELRQVEETVERFETLQSSGSAKPLANPVGFLYRAVEDSERYPIPSSFQPAKKAAVNNRPERKLVRSSRLAPQAPGSNSDTVSGTGPGQGTDPATRATLELSRLSAEELKQLRQPIESKLQTLRGILSPARFEEAVQGCLRDEMIRRLTAK